MPGVKETKEFLDLIKAIGIAVAAEVKKDGFQPKDLLAFLQSQEFDAKLRPAIEGVEQVPVELQDLNFFETIDLGRYSYNVVQDILEALAKR